MGFPHLDDTNADVLAQQAFQCLIPKERHCDEKLSVIFIPIRQTDDKTQWHGRGIDLGVETPWRHDGKPSCMSKQTVTLVYWFWRWLKGDQRPYNKLLDFMTIIQHETYE